MHVTTRIRADAPRLRNRKACKVIRKAMMAVMDEPGFRICQFSVQGNHLHLIVEAKNNAAMARGMKRFKQRVAQGINGLHGRKGSLFLDRYHMEILRTPRQTRAAICYVMHNARRHGVSLPRWANGIDPFSSAWWFDGWKDHGWRKGLGPPGDGARCVQPAGTWLLETGWRRHGLIATTDVPAAARSRASRP